MRSFENNTRTPLPVESDGPIGFATPDTQMVSVARCSTLVNADTASNGVAVLRPHLRRVKRITSFAGRARVRPLRDRQEIIGQVLFHHTCGRKRDGTALIEKVAGTAAGIGVSADSSALAQPTS